MNHPDDPMGEMKDAHLEQVYHGLCKCPDIERAVGAMHSETLRELHGYLCRMNVESGIPGLVRGVVMMECCERFLKRQ